MGQHTPGPWTIYEPEKDITAYDEAADRTVTVAIISDDAEPERAANAALISAAPAMLEALRETMAALTDITNAAENGEAYTFEELAKVTFQKPINDAFLAIAAAEGK